MATIKNYTDIEQSKVLAKILPLESADMHYSKDFDGSWFVDLDEYTSVKIPKYVVNIEEHLLPCWSLASLLDIIKKTIGYTLQTTYNKDPKVFIVCELDEKPYSIASLECDNEVDACVAMIEKLNERKML